MGMIVITTIDILPDHCYQCPCHDGESGYCQADKEKRHSDYRPYWCPLKEISKDVHKPIMRTTNMPNWGKGKRRYQDDYGRFTKEAIARYFGDSKEKENNNEDHQSGVSDSQAGYGRSESADGYLQGH